MILLCAACAWMIDTPDENLIKSIKTNISHRLIQKGKKTKNIFKFAYHENLYSYLLADDNSLF